MTVLDAHGWALPDGLPPLPEPLGVPTTDAHTHLASTWRHSGLPVETAIEAARAAGVVRLVDVGTDVASSAETIAIADVHPGVVASIALHPNDAARAGDRLADELAALEALIGTSPRVRGIGETGLDYYRTRDEKGKRHQKDAFAAHIAWARQHDLALVIHDRDAHDDILDVLDAEGWPQRVMMHCFSGDAAFARRCLDRGAWLSFPGTVTFKANEALREAFDTTPDDRFLVETDAPYLTPMPYRGKPNASYLIPHTLRFLAQRRGSDADALAALAHANATALFGAWGDDPEPADRQAATEEADRRGDPGRGAGLEPGHLDGRSDPASIDRAADA